MNKCCKGILIIISSWQFWTWWKTKIKPTLIKLLFTYFNKILFPKRIHAFFVKSKESISKFDCSNFMPSFCSVSSLKLKRINWFSKFLGNYLSNAHFLQFLFKCQCLILRLCKKRTTKSYFSYSSMHLSLWSPKVFQQSTSPEKY